MSARRERVELEINIDTSGFRRSALRLALTVAGIDTKCQPCRYYLRKRSATLVDYIFDSDPLPGGLGVALSRLVAGVHARHQAGLPILPAGAITPQERLLLAVFGLKDGETVDEAVQSMRRSSQ